MLQFSKHYSFNPSESDLALMDEARQTVREEMVSNRIGYYKLPSHSLAHLEALKEMDIPDASQIVVIGIGGSSLGIKAIDSILRPYTADAKEMLFFENSDPITISETLQKVRRDDALFFIISKSGGTIETTSIFKTVIKHFSLDLDGADNNRVFAITDQGSVLSQFAQSHGIGEFTIPDNVGGRFSVLSAVGVVPLSLAGYDMLDLLAGAGSMITSFMEGGEAHLLEKACFYATNSETQRINVLFSYADRLEDLTKWYVQLWGESLGKIDRNKKRVGLTPIGIIGAVDQHSFLQLVIEGPQDKSLTFVSIEDFGNDLTIPDLTLEHIEKTNFINGQTFNRLINAQCDATMQSVIESGTGADAIKMDRVSPENIGALIAYYELLTSLVGAMLHVNTYDQPGVELGKQILYKNLSN